MAIEYRWAEGRNERYLAIADEFVRMKVDLIFTSGGAVPVIKQATGAIPIVFALGADPVGGGLVASLARPGGNVTGVATLGGETATKRFEVLRELIPGLVRLAIMGNVGNPSTALDMREVQAVASALSVAVSILAIRTAEDIARAIGSIEGRVDALYVVTDPLVITNRVRINSLALAARLPTMHGFREGVEAGGLMSYGASYTSVFRRAGDYVDNILRGAKPVDLPVELPTKFDLVINLTTAKRLGLSVPESFLLRADEVIE
jgi:putative ABC transport system substrate-binding protein